MMESQDNNLNDGSLNVDHDDAGKNTESSAARPLKSSGDLSGENRLNWILDGSDISDQIPGPVGAEVDLNGVKKSSNLYPLDEDLSRDGAAGHKDEDLGINSDGSNPGSEYLSPLNETGEE